MLNDLVTEKEALSFLKTRIAPTPSGYLHLGNVLSFALTAALAEQYGARILLRIDDMDRERFDIKYVRDIFDTLRFLELPWHEGPEDEQSFVREYAQVHRMEHYNRAFAQLREQGALFACDCSRSFLLKNDREGRYLGHCTHKDLPFDNSDVCWRLHTGDELIPVKTLSGTTHNILPGTMRYFVVRKKDQHPAYQLSSLIDDGYYGVDLIIRGADLWPSTLAQCYLAQQLNRNDFLNSTFVHHPLINDPDGAKLSKSTGATSVRYLRQEGKKPSDIYALIGNMLGLQGDPAKDWQTLAQKYRQTSLH